MNCPHCDTEMYLLDERYENHVLTEQYFVCEECGCVAVVAEPHVKVLGLACFRVKEEN